MMIDTRLKPFVSPIPEELHMDDNTTTDEQAYSSSDQPATPEPAWSIPSSNLTIPTNNWASALKSTYTPLPENSLFCINPETRQQFNDVFQMEECHKLLTDQVDDAILRYNVSKPLSLGGDPSHVTIQPDFFFNKDLEYLRQRFYIDRHTSEGDRRAVRTHMRILSVVRIEVFPIYGYNYMKKIVLRRADLKEYFIAERDFKYLYPVIDSPRAVTFRDKYGVQMIMRFNEIYKFIDGTLQHIDEALDYRVKEFRVNRMNSGLDTWFWMKKDVDRSKEFMFAI
ncbi:hypothetical protein Tco_1199268 [Tanacetum coccineum]